MSDQTRILYVQNGFHPNQYEFVDGLIRSGAEVGFAARIRKSVDSDAPIRPTILGTSPISRPLIAAGGLYHFAFPKLRRLVRTMREFNADVLVVRGYGLMSLIPMVIGVVMGAQIIVEEQKTWRTPDPILLKLVNSVFALLSNHPIARVSPIGMQRVDLPHRHRIPFVCPSAGGSTGTPTPRLRIVHVGKLDQRRKNHILMLEVFRRLSDEFEVELVLAGQLRGVNEHTREMLDYIVNHGLEQRVSVVANVPNQAVRGLFKDADVFVLNSYDEPCAYSFIEAMSVGTPVVVTADNGSSEYITDGEHGLIVDPRDGNALYDALQSLLASPKRREKLAAHGRALVESNHDPDRWVRYFLDEVVVDSPL